MVAPGAGTTYYGPWMPRQGNSLSAVLEVIDAMLPFTLKLEVQTKNHEDSDASPTLLTGNATATGVETKDVSVSGAKELVRFKFTATGDPGGDTPTATWVHFRTNQPIWQPN